MQMPNLHLLYLSHHTIVELISTDPPLPISERLSEPRLDLRRVRGIGGIGKVGLPYVLVAEAVVGVGRMIIV